MILVCAIFLLFIILQVRYRHTNISFRFYLLILLFYTIPSLFLIHINPDYFEILKLENIREFSLYAEFIIGSCLLTLLITKPIDISTFLTRIIKRIFVFVWSASRAFGIDIILFLPLLACIYTILLTDFGYAGAQTFSLFEKVLLVLGKLMSPAIITSVYLLFDSNSFIKTFRGIYYSRIFILIGTPIYTLFCIKLANRSLLLSLIIGLLSVILFNINFRKMFIYLRIKYSLFFGIFAAIIFLAFLNFILISRDSTLTSVTIFQQLRDFTIPITTLHMAISSDFLRPAAMLISNIANIIPGLGSNYIQQDLFTQPSELGTYFRSYYTSNDGFAFTHFTEAFIYLGPAAGLPFFLITSFVFSIFKSVEFAFASHRRLSICILNSLIFAIVRSQTQTILTYLFFDLVFSYLLSRSFFLNKKLISIHCSKDIQ